MVSRDPFTRNVCVCGKGCGHILKVMFLHMSVILSTGGCIPACITGHMTKHYISSCTGDQSQLVQGQHTGNVKCMTLQADTPTPSIRSILLECILVKTVSMVMKHRRREVIPESFVCVCVTIDTRHFNVDVNANPTFEQGFRYNVNKSLKGKAKTNILVE